MTERLRTKAFFDQDDVPPGLDAASESTIYPHVFGNPDREVGGVIVGRAGEGSSPPTITGAIRAVGAIERPAALTFTQSAWAHIHRELESEHSDDAEIVGWYHSHPAIGIYLSEYDLFIHRNFFALPTQIAVVVDPVARSEGLFAWEDGEVAKRYERPTPEEWLAGSQSESAT